MGERLILKWGTLKGWDVQQDGPAAAMLKIYLETDVNVSVMAQRDGIAQKQMICDIIDAIDGTIYNDWSGKNMTKEEAKDYIMDY